MKSVFKIAAGVVLGMVVLIVGCGVIVSSSLDSTTESQDAAVSVAKVEVEKSGSKLTPGQENALKQGQSYVDHQAFSKSGLVQQLSSDFEGYSKKDAVFAANHVQVNWNAEAVESARGYLEFQSFSRDGLAEQLRFEGFTPAQAKQAVVKVYR